MQDDGREEDDLPEGLGEDHDRDDACTEEELDEYAGEVEGYLSKCV